MRRLTFHVTNKIEIEMKSYIGGGYFGFCSLRASTYKSPLEQN